MANVNQDQTGRRVNYATYPYDYFTGSQVRVFFGGVWVDDIATIQYQTEHRKIPLYGYNDHQFRTVAKGQFIVNGNFTIAFKETGYFNIIMSLIKDENSGLAKVLRRNTSNPKFTFNNNKTNAMIKFLNFMGRGLTPEEALDEALGDEFTEFAGARDFPQKRRREGTNRDFEDIAEVMEDAIWGSPRVPDAFKRRLPRSDEQDYNKFTGGDGDENDIDVGGFDILLSFGDFRRNEAEHTVVSLNDVHILGESMVITPAGDPIGINYTFMCRGLNERVSSQEFRIIDVNKKAGAPAPGQKKDPTAEEIDQALGAVNRVQVFATNFSNTPFDTSTTSGAPLFDGAIGSGGATGLGAVLPFPIGSNKIFDRPISELARLVTGITTVPTGGEVGKIPRDKLNILLETMFNDEVVFGQMAKRMSILGPSGPSITGNGTPDQSSSIGIHVIVNLEDSGKIYKAVSHPDGEGGRTVNIIDDQIDPEELRAQTSIAGDPGPAQPTPTTDQRHSGRTDSQQPGTTVPNLDATGTTQTAPGTGVNQNLIQQAQGNLDQQEELEQAIQDSKLLSEGDQELVPDDTPDLTAQQDSTPVSEPAPPSSTVTAQTDADEPVPEDIPDPSTPSVAPSDEAAPEVANKIEQIQNNIPPVPEEQEQITPKLNFATGQAIGFSEDNAIQNATRVAHEQIPIDVEVIDEVVTFVQPFEGGRFFAEVELSFRPNKLDESGNN